MKEQPRSVHDGFFVSREASPVVVEDFIRDNASMLVEVIAVVISKLIDGSLLLTHLPTLLPYPVLVVQVL